MSRPPDPFEAARGIGWVADPTPIYQQAAEEWAAVALPKLLRSNHGRWYGTYLGDRAIPMPYMLGSFGSPAAGALLVGHLGSYDPGKRDFPPFGPDFRKDIPPAHAVAAYPAHGLDTVILKPWVAPPDSRDALLLTWLDEHADVPFQASAHHFMIEPKSVAPYNVPGSMVKRAWFIARRNLIHPDWLGIEEYQRKASLPAQTMRTGCYGAPLFAERARFWNPLTEQDAQWFDPCDQTEWDEDTPVRSLEDVLDDFRAVQAVDFCLTARLRAAHGAAVKAAVAKCHPLAPWPDNDGVPPRPKSKSPPV